MQPKQLVYGDYRISAVVFADVLGMGREILSIDDEECFNSVATILEVLREQARQWRSMDGILQDLQATAVSDSLIISIPGQSEGGASALILAMHSFQYALLCRARHLLRGYLAPGRLYHKDEVIFGEGYIRALNGELGLKNGPPRIVLDPDLAAYALAMGSTKPKDGYISAFEALRHDVYDGLWFIDYLKPMNLRDEDSLKEIREDRERILLWIKTQQETYEKEHHVKAKYVWLEQYEATTRAEFERILALNHERAGT